MSIVKSVSYRALDLAIIWMLIYGSQGFQTFALWVVGIMTVFIWIGLFFEFKPDAVKELGLENRALRILSAFVSLAYTCALIVYGAPVLAAFYFLGIVSVMFKFYTALDRAKKEAA